MVSRGSGHVGHYLAARGRLFRQQAAVLVDFLSIMLLYLLVVGTAGTTIWLVGAKVVEQVRELAVTAVDWPDKIDKKAKGWLPEDAYEAVSGQTETFKQYWREMFGVDDSADTRFTKEESTALDELAPADHKVFLALDEDERAAYLLIDETDERNVYLAKKAEEIRNRNMETFGQQGEQIAEQSAKVLKSAWSSLLGFFTQLTYLAVIPIYMFYFLGSKRDLLEDFEQELGFLSPRVREDVVFLIREFVGILVAFFRGQLLIGLLMGVGYAIGFQISGLKFGLALGLLSVSSTWCLISVPSSASPPLSLSHTSSPPASPKRESGASSSGVA